MKKKWRFAPVLVFWVTLEIFCSVVDATPQVPYPGPQNGYATPYGCYDTNQGADGPQVGHTEVATITLTPGQPPFVAHVTVVVSQGFWLMQVRSSWDVWNNEDGINNRTHEMNEPPGAPPGIVAVACPYPCTISPPLPTTSTTIKEPYCAAPPTTHLSLPSTSTTSPSTSSTVTIQASNPSTAPPAQAQVEAAVVATPQFTG